MPRIFRFLPEIGVFHILSRGNNRQKVFRDDKDYQFYLELLQRYKEEHNFLLYHYCLMPNHVHLILETTRQTDLSKLMKQINLKYHYYFRRRYRYCGHLWQGRFKSLLIEKDSYLIACARYIERNPVRAKMVEKAEDYRWSSYLYYVNGKNNPLLDRDPLYQGLGVDDKKRQESYQLSLDKTHTPNLNLRFIGSNPFIKAMEEKFGIKNLKSKRGRPIKANK